MRFTETDNYATVVIRVPASRAADLKLGAEADVAWIGWHDGRTFGQSPCEIVRVTQPVGLDGLLDDVRHKTLRDPSQGQSFVVEAHSRDWSNCPACGTGKYRNELTGERADLRHPTDANHICNSSCH